MLVTLKEILQDASNKKYAVGSFNILNLEMARGIIEAAELENSPLILSLAEVHLPIIPFEYATIIMQKIARDAKVPVCLHFDHGTDFHQITYALKAGFTSVMYDGSVLPYEENIQKTREVLKAAQIFGASVEAELGHVGGAEGQEKAEDTSHEEYTKVDQVTDFISRTEIDALAVAVGTAHGKYVKPPVLDIGRLAEINQVSAKPLVLHGGSGLSDEDFRTVVQNGIRKINICTELCLAAHQTFSDCHDEKKSFELSIVAAKNAVREATRKRMRLFGSAQKA